MFTLKYAVLCVFLLVVLVLGLWSVFGPDSLIAFRRRMGWPNDFWSGGYFYATAQRARIVGALTVVASLVGLLLVLAKLR